MKIFMDDVRPVEYGYIVSRDVEETLQLVRENDVEVLSLDYNMGMRKKNGLDFVKQFCKEGLFVPKITIHSNDIIGARKMMEYLEGAKEEGFISSEIRVEYYY